MQLYCVSCTHTYLTPLPGCAGAASVTDDRLYAFEAVGVLLGQDELPAEQQLQALEGLLNPLLSQMETHLPQCAAQQQQPSGSFPGGTGES